MNPVVVLLLFCIWVYLAYTAYMRGQTGLAVLFLVAGVALAFYRLRRRPAA